MKLIFNSPGDRQKSLTYPDKNSRSYSPLSKLSKPQSFLAKERQNLFGRAWVHGKSLDSRKQRRIKGSGLDRGVSIKRMSRRFFSRIGKIILFFLVFSLLIFFLSLFRVKRVVCWSGSLNCPAEIWLEFFSKLEGKSLLFFSEKKLKDEFLRKFVQFRGMEISYFFPDGLEIKLAEREAIGQLYYLSGEKFSFFSKKQRYFADLARDFLEGEKVWIFDGQGVIFFQREYEPFLPATVASGETILGKSLESIEERMILELDLMLKKRELSAIYWFTGQSLDRSIILVNDDWQAQLSSQKDLELQLDSLQLILIRAKIEGKILREIDLRPSKPVVIFAN